MTEPDVVGLDITPKLIFRIILRLAIVIGALAAILFLSAGRLDWVEAWLFIIEFGFFLILYAAGGMAKAPAQLEERSKVAENVKSWDKVIMGIYTVLLVVLFSLAGIDAGRFGWTSLPTGARIIGWVGLILAGSIIFWAIVANTYLSRMARIQTDRDHQVVTSGPYRYVRHPMYLGNIVLFLCIPLALGSGWAVIPGSSIAVLFFVRTALEDQMLRGELKGYQEYAQRVRYRLFPGIW